MHNSITKKYERIFKQFSKHGTIQNFHNKSDGEYHIFSIEHFNLNMLFPIILIKHAILIREEVNDHANLICKN